MAGQTVTRADLCDAVCEEVGLSRVDAAELVESIINELSDALVRGEPVKLSSFGSFLVRDKGERWGRNPKTGEAARIAPRKVLVFRPSHILRDRMNGIDSSGEDDGSE
ncbi:MAG: integration host factor subunit alpha [Alphaproteobacteria bacterium]|jgi:integration host factor subunit alpha